METENEILDKYIKEDVKLPVNYHVNDEFKESIKDTLGFNLYKLNYHKEQFLFELRKSFLYKLLIFDFWKKKIENYFLTFKIK